MCFCVCISVCGGGGGVLWAHRTMTNRGVCSRAESNDKHI